MDRIIVKRSPALVVSRAAQGPAGAGDSLASILPLTVSPSSGNTSVGTTHTHALSLTLSDLSGQPLDSDLTAISALTTQIYGRSLLELTSAAAGRSLLGAAAIATTLAGYGITDAQAFIVGTTAADYYRGDKTFQALNKAAVGLENVDNTTDLNKPVSTATQSALNLKVNSTLLGAVSGVATLDGSGKLNASQLPALALVDTFVVASQAAMLALASAEQGDVAIRTDINKTFILTTAPFSVLGNWKELLTPTDTVTSVFGRNGAVTAQAGDYTFAQLSATPTTIAGYGITDSNPAYTGDVTKTFNGTFLTLAVSGVIAGSYGSASLIPVFTVDAKGRITTIATSAIAAPLSGLTGLGTNVAAWLATPSSANLLAAVTDETGTGPLVFATNPILVTPNIGAATGTSLSVTGAFTSTVAIGTAPLVVTSTTLVANLYGSRAVLADSVTTNANLTGEVTSLGNVATLTNSAVIGKVLTGYVSGAGVVAATDSILQAIQKLNGNNATNANLTGPITSLGNATSVAAQTGTGSVFVMQASPTLTTPNIGLATATTLGVGIAPQSGALLFLSNNAGAATGVAQRAVATSMLVLSTGTTYGAAFVCDVSTQTAAFTVGDLYGLLVQAGSQGAGSTITRNTGVFVSDLTAGISNFGVRVAVNAGTNKWAVHADGTANNLFAGFVGLGSAVPAASLDMSGNVVAASWTVNGIGLRLRGNTYTNNSTAASGTAATNHIHAIAVPTLAATNTGVITTTAATLFIAGAPIAGTNMTITTPLALQVLSGVSQFGGLVSTPASTASSAGLRVIHGAAPSAPTNGDIWTTTAGMFIRVNGVTKTVTLT